MTHPDRALPLSPDDLEDLRFAKALLEHPNLAARVTNMIGLPLERGLQLLPKRWQEQVQKASSAALGRALELSLETLDARRGGRSRDRFHKLLVASTGGLGGAFGLAGLGVELPVSTSVILRSIADIARSEGEDLELAEVRMACLEVFALGARAESDDAAEVGYFTLRATLAKAVSEALQHVARRGALERSAPALAGLIARISARFGVSVSQKVAAQAIPLVGAAGGALVNTLFIDHFQGVARGHFVVRRLERTHGSEAVRAAYERL